MTLHSLSKLLLAVVVVVAVAGCEGNPVVGNLCRLTNEPALDQIVLESPSFDCESHLCLGAPTGSGAETRALCTASCEVDDDCNAYVGSECDAGFVCAVPVEVGRFCCERMCMCSDSLPVGVDPTTVPAACDPSNAGNACCNLPGREC